MRPALRVFSHSYVTFTHAIPNNAVGLQQRFIAPCCTSSASAVLEEESGAPATATAANMVPFACVGIDTDMSGAIVLVKSERDDDMARTGFAQGGVSMVRTPQGCK